MCRFLGVLALHFCVLYSLSAANLLAQSNCSPYPAPPGNHIVKTVSTTAALRTEVNNAASNTTIMLKNGTYNIGSLLNFNTPNITLRSESGNRDLVILDGQYNTSEVIKIRASNITIADLTIQKAFDHPIHVESGGNHATFYNIKIIDGRQQFLKVNPHNSGVNDYGLVACSHFEMTNAGRQFIHNNPTPGGNPCYTGGIDAHQALGWIVRDSVFKNIYCTNGGLAEHAIHFWKTSKDPIIERNEIINCARGIGFGLGTGGGHRTYNPPTPNCPSSAGHFGGIIRNNFVCAAIGSEYDTGIGLEQACGSTVEHNTIYSEQGSFNSAIDVRFQYTNAVVKDNLYFPQMTTRNGATPTKINNLKSNSSMFPNLASCDLHIGPTATTVIDQGSGTTIPDDFDGQLRDTFPDIGADECIDETCSQTGGGDTIAPAPPTNLNYN